MKASLDTNIIIHLYRSGQKDILFSLFDEEIYIYEFLVNCELKNHGPDVISEFKADVSEGKIKIITDDDLRKIGMFPLFRRYFKEQDILYEPGDRGEVYAIALAKTLGTVALVTDDTKIGGPHATLIRQTEEDIIPFTVLELLFMLVLIDKISPEEAYKRYLCIINSGVYSPSIKSSFELFVQRFSLHSYTDREVEWMEIFCQKERINFEEKINLIKKTIKKNIVYKSK